MPALVAGYEYAAALGELVAPGHGMRGRHPSATIGTFGAAVGAAGILRLDSDAFAGCLAMAATQAAGVRGVFGGTAKSLNFGKAAHSGVIAALLARSGMTAPGEVVWGETGFFAAAGGADRIAAESGTA